MPIHLLSAWMKYSPNLCKQVGACLRLGVTFFLALLMWLLTTHSAMAVTPIGTTVNNQAQLSYPISATENRVITSNNETFSVEGFGVDDNALIEIQQAPQIIDVYAGEDVSYAITLFNRGDNTLASGQLIINAPVGATIDSSVGIVTNQMTTAALQTNSYQDYFITLPDLAFMEQLDVAITIHLPINLQSGVLTIGSTYHANNQNLAYAEFSLNLLARTDAVLEVMRYNPQSTDIMSVGTTRYFDGNQFVTLLEPYNAGPIPQGDPVPISAASEFSHGQTIFLRLIDPDQNRLPTAIDKIEVNLDIAALNEVERLELSETSVNSGVFTGYINFDVTSHAQYSGSMGVETDAEMGVNYQDKLDLSDLNVSVVMVDPYGMLFDSETGQLLDGYIIQLLDENGNEAVVYGDDQVSRFPAIVTTGSTITDEAGTLYHFAPGAFRYPFVEPGNYYLNVTPPEGDHHTWPSSKSTASFSGLPNAPFSIEIGSRGELFEVLAGPPMHIDIPVDPGVKQLYVQRQASKQQVAAGDFLQFNVTVEPVVEEVVLGTNLVDTLPRGFRYKPSTATINGVPYTPTLSEDGRQLSFEVGDLIIGSHHEVSYIVEVGVAKPGQAVSSSQGTANNGALASNTASVTTTVIEEFMLSKNILMGQVVVVDEEGNTTEEGLSGVRIYMEDGRYVVTDERGRYHFDNVTPGTHVIQLDTDTLPPVYEAVLFDNNTRYAGRAWSKFVELQGGTLWQANFYTALRKKPSGHLQLQMNNQPLSDSGILPLQVTLNNETVQLSNLSLMIALPEGTSYVADSSQLNGDESILANQNGNLLTYTLPDIQGDGSYTLNLQLALAPEAEGELITKAMLSFDTPEKAKQRSSVIEHKLLRMNKELNREQREFTLRPYFDILSSELKETDKAKLLEISQQLAGLENIRITSLGYSDNKKIRYRSHSIYKSNQQLSEERALAVANTLRDALKLTPQQISAVGMGEKDPIADNNSEAGRALNRRVELHITADKVETGLVFEQPTVQSDMEEIPTLGQRPGEAQMKSVEEAQPIVKEKPVYDEVWLSTATSDIEWLQPIENALPAIPSTKVAIKHEKGQKLQLLLNSEAVPMVNFDGTFSNRQNASLSLWSGVNLKDGDNLFEVIIRNQQDQEITRLSRAVHYSTPPVYAELVEKASVLIADGMTQPVITLRLTDKQGYPARLDVKGEFSLNAPYLAAYDKKIHIEQLPGAAAKRQTYIVEEDGLVRIKLEPTTQSGEVAVTLPLVDGEHTIKARLKSASRDWIVVGFAEGSVGYNTLKGNQQELEGNSSEEDIYSDGQVAFFAKGTVLGKWLLTMSYDSDKETQGNDPALFQAIDPTQYYTVYGDASYQGVDAASREKLYLKLERDEFYALFGDYNTEMTGSKLSGYNRALTGFKSEYHGDALNVLLFSSESNQAFIQEELLGNGTTGPYPLSRGNIVINSELITIEERNRFNNSEVASSRTLQRHVDYTINYTEGTIEFRHPVQRLSADLNLNVIVVKYESFDEQDRSHTYGGRIAYQISNKTKVTLSGVSEGRVGGESILAGVEVDHHFTQDTKLHIEAAHTSSQDNTTDKNGDAYLVELEHRGNKLDAKLYAQQADQTFGIGQTSTAQLGTRQLGAQAKLKVSSQVTLSTKAEQTENLDEDNTRQLVEIESQVSLGQNNLKAGLRSAKDEMANGTETQSNQLTLGASRSMLDNKVQLRIDRDQSLGQGDNVDYPTVTRIGADYRVTEHNTLFVEQEWSESDARDTQYTQAGIKSTPWQGGELFTGVKRNDSATDVTTTGNVALKQKLALNEKWSLDLAAERSETLDYQSTSQFNSDTVGAYDNGDFTAYATALTYSPETWQWNIRAELREGSNTTNRKLATSLYTQLNSRTEMTASLQLSEDETLNTLSRNSSIALDLAYRPSYQGWIVLDRLELMTQESTTPEFGYDNWRIINNLNSSYLSDNWQLALQLGVKYLKENIAMTEYSGVTNLYGMEYRYDLNSEWDLGAQVSSLHSINTSQSDTSAGLSIGHNFMENIWLSLGYNFVGFEDRDFASARTTSQGIYLRFRIKFDQQSLKEGMDLLKK